MLDNWAKNAGKSLIIIFKKKIFLAIVNVADSSTYYAYNIRVNVFFFILFFFSILTE
jgi:hypothetical protein